MSKPWSGIGAWAAEAERAEEEEREAAAAVAASQVESQSFPSLKEAAVSAKPKKKKMTLSEFTMGSYKNSSAGSLINENKGLTTEEMLRLPTGPKERSAEEMQYNRLGGGFSSYGGRSGPSQGRMRDREESGGSWGGGGRRSYGGFDDERGGPPSRVSDFDQPSRADEVDNWAVAKKSLPAFDSGRQNRYGSLGGGGMGGGGGGGGFSRADEVDNWANGKKPPPTRSSTFGSGFRDSAEPDRWSRGGGGSREDERERPRLILDPPKGNVGQNESEQKVKSNKPNPFGAAKPREEVLAEKGLDWKKLDLEIEAKKTSRPTSSHSSRPSSAQSSRSVTQGLQGLENVVRPTRPKINPFGDAKPREVLLEEKGKDWRKIDQQLERRGVYRPEAEEEKILKQEIDNLTEELEKEAANKGPVSESAGDQPNLHDIIVLKERELEILSHDLNEKVLFVQKPFERPSSGAGRATGFLDRPSSQSGSFDESRSFEPMDRPRSRGLGDAWSRPFEDQRGFQGGNNRGFLGNRDSDRSRSRDRW